MTETPPSARPVFGRGRYSEVLRIGRILRMETVGGGLLVVAAIIAIIWANSPWADAYFALRDVRFGPEELHLNLSLGAWAADGLLAIFFFMVGLELKREFVAGELRNFSQAVVPIAAAVGGVIVPAVIYAIINSGDPAAIRGWAIPTATDIAFAVAVLAVIGSHLPAALRLFLLTLAVVDDLLAITIIAIFYTDEIDLAPLFGALAVIAVYGLLVQRFRTFFARNTLAPWLILLPIGFVAWALLHASGIHATVAGVLLAFTVPVLHRKRDAMDASAHGLAEVFEHRFRPLSAGFAVPVFAFLSAGVAIGGGGGFIEALTDPVTIGIIIALVVGKPIGIVASTWIITRVTRAQLDPTVKWIDLVGVGLLAGIGFTVSLLVAELSFGLGSEFDDHAKIGILLASVLAALFAAAILVTRNRRYRAIARLETIDEDGDGIPDVYQEDRRS